MKISLNPRTIFFLLNLIVLPLVALSLFNSPQNCGLPATLIFFLVGWYDVIQKEEAYPQSVSRCGTPSFYPLRYFTRNTSVFH